MAAKPLYLWQIYLMTFDDKRKYNHDTRRYYQKVISNILLLKMPLDLASMKRYVQWILK